jgi:hypothetical protein
VNGNGAAEVIRRMTPSQMRAVLTAKATALPSEMRAALADLGASNPTRFRHAIAGLGQPWLLSYLGRPGTPADAGQGRPRCPAAG